MDNSKMAKDKAKINYSMFAGDDGTPKMSREVDERRSWGFCDCEMCCIGGECRCDEKKSADELLPTTGKDD